MKITPIAIMAALIMPPACFAASPYEPSSPPPVGPGVEEIWTDSGVKYYRGLPGVKPGSQPRTPGAQRYQPEVEYSSPQPMGAPAVKAPRKTPSRAVAKKPAARKAAAAPAKKRVKKKAPAKRPAQVARVVTPPAQQAPKPAPLPELPPGWDPFSGQGILGTTRLQ